MGSLNVFVLLILALSTSVFAFPAVVDRSATSWQALTRPSKAQVAISERRRLLSRAAAADGAKSVDWYSLQNLPSSNPNYNADEVRADLLHIMKWAYDEGNLDGALLNETIAAIMSAAARYYPEVPTRAMCRTIISDIKAESDFQTDLVSGGRLDCECLASLLLRITQISHVSYPFLAAGSSWGLLQVSPGENSQELNLFKEHVRTTRNTFSWTSANGTAGPLIDWDTGDRLLLYPLTNDDLFRPWVNIHVAMWVQSNSARTSSEDPSLWDGVASAAAAARSAEARYAASRTASSKSALTTALRQEATSLTGAGLPRSVRTGLGTWVAGAATDGAGSYNQTGDDISAQYIRTIAEVMSELYGKKIGASWFDGLQVNAGLVDYR